MRLLNTDRPQNTDKAQANSETITTKPKTTLNVAIWDAVGELSYFISEPEFFTKMKTVFGENINYQNLSSATLPALEILSTENLNGANGAYSVDTNTIYLSKEFISSNLENPEAIADLLLEEIGHSVDNLLNENDTPGDEGEHFAAVVNNKTLSLAEIARITREDDTGTIIVDGKTISIEQQVINGTDGNDSIVGTEEDDTIAPGLGKDTVDGVSGDDLLIVDYADHFSERKYPGIASYRPNSGAGFYRAIGSTTNIISFEDIEQIDITGTKYNDNVITDDGNDRIIGGNGNDTLNGKAGTDFLSGGVGRDFIDGGSGNDTIDGGEGNDTLVEADFSAVTTNLLIDNSGKSIVNPDGDSVSNIEYYNNLITGSGNDTIRFSQFAGSNNIATGNGDDTISSGMGKDTVDGGSGDDLLIVDYADHYSRRLNPGIVSFKPNSGAGFYRAISSTANIISFENIEQIYINGTKYNDKIITDDGNDRIIGGNGNDTLNGKAGTDFLSGGVGRDFIDGGSGNDTIDGGEGNDTISSGSGNDTIDGGEGNDTLVEADFSAVTTNLLIDNSGKFIVNPDGDSVSNIEYYNNLITGSGNDTIRFSQFAGSNNIATGNGDDTIDGGGGNDTINGGEGNDTLVEADFSAVTTNLLIDDSGKSIVNPDGDSVSNIEYYNNLITGSGNDTIRFSQFAGSNNIATGNGDDTISSGMGKDTVDGGSGDDLLIVDYSDHYSRRRNPGIASANYRPNSGIGVYRALGSTANIISFENIEQIDITGTKYNDNIVTDDGNDRIIGGSGNDTLYGRVGTDVLFGGLDYDIISGGEGRDTFVLMTNANTKDRDTIRDFELGNDLLGVSDMTEVDNLSISNNSDNTGSIIAGNNGQQVAILMGVTDVTIDDLDFVEI